MHNIPLKMKHAPGKGFFMVIPRSISPDSIPDFFVEQHQTRDAIQCTTLELLKFSHRAQESTEEIYLITDRYLNNQMCNA